MNRQTDRHGETKTHQKVEGGGTGRMYRNIVKNERQYKWVEDGESNYTW